MTIVTNGTDQAGLPPRSRILRRLTGRVNLSGLDGHDLARAVQRVADFPRGARVLLIVGPGQYPPGMALDYVSRYGAHLASLDIQCSDPYTATAWGQALDDPAGVTW